MRELTSEERAHLRTMDIQGGCTRKYTYKEKAKRVQRILVQLGYATYTDTLCCITDAGRTVLESEPTNG